MIYETVFIKAIRMTSLIEASLIFHAFLQTRGPGFNSHFRLKFYSRNNNDASYRHYIY